MDFNARIGKPGPFDHRGEIKGDTVDFDLSGDVERVVLETPVSPRPLIPNVDHSSPYASPQFGSVHNPVELMELPHSPQDSTAALFLEA